MLTLGYAVLEYHNFHELFQNINGDRKIEIDFGIPLVEGYCNMNYANSKKGIILNGLKQSRIVGRKENYTHEKKSFIKEVKKVIEKGLENMTKEARAILASIKISKMDRIAA